MNIKGNILQIKNKRESKNQNIEIAIDKITYITHKKDGRYFQPFELIENLNTPLIITGDFLARSDNKYLEEGEHEFKVYDQVGDSYELNPNKHLLVTMAHDFDTAEIILTAVDYTVTVGPEEFKKLNSRKSPDKEAQKGKDGQKK